ncbi:hypothetical protein F4824DRAFT_474084 [Ustulina deusta]|nr:hypothetical protein F4824DRAFT_474084 [Ustulina deusta]
MYCDTLGLTAIQSPASTYATPSTGQPTTQPIPQLTRRHTMAANSLPEGYTLVEGYPSLEDYQNLRAVCVSAPKTPEQITASLKGSWYGVYVVGDAAPTKAVAMGRVIGDGGWYFLIADMVTLPEHRRKGLADVVMKTLLARIKSRAAKGTAYVTLGADPPGLKLYRRNGFKDTLPDVTGMELQIECEGLEE